MTTTDGNEYPNLPQQCSCGKQNTAGVCEHVRPLPMSQPFKPSDETKAVQPSDAREFRLKWSHKPTPIPADAQVGELWYSETCTEQLMEAYAAHSRQQDAQRISSLRASLLACLRAAGGYASDEVSDNFLSFVANEVKLLKERGETLEAEVARLTQENAEVIEYWRKLHEKTLSDLSAKVRKAAHELICTRRVLVTPMTASFSEAEDFLAVIIERALTE